MDTVAALMAPRIVDLDGCSLDTFLSPGRLRIVHAHDGSRSFGILLKALLHGALGTHLRCGRLDLRGLSPPASDLRAILVPWADLAGVAGSFPPPPGYYLLRGRNLLGYHPEPEGLAHELPALASAGLQGMVALLRQADAGEAARGALSDRPEVDMLRFFREASFGTTPRRAPSASDRRSGRERRGGPREGDPRRATERLRSDLASACAILGVAVDTPLREVKRARNRLMRAYHPDRLAADPRLMAEATRMTVRLNAAWATIERARDEQGR